MGNFCCSERPNIEEKTGFHSPVWEDTNQPQYYSGGQNFVANHSTVGDSNPNLGKTVRWQ